MGARMLSAEIEKKIDDFRDLGIPSYIPRENKVPMVDRMVTTITGARRSGKSFRVLQVADEMRRKGTVKSLKQVCYLDFDNPILASMEAKELSSIQTTFLKKNPEFNLSTTLLFAFDEIQKIPGWEDYVIDLSRNHHWKVVVTGSSSKLMKERIASSIRGKALTCENFPLSYSEYLKFHRHDAANASTKSIADRKRLFDCFLHGGGYPATALLDNYACEIVLRDYFDTMLLKDIVERNNVAKPRPCLHLYRYLLSNIARPVTMQSGYRFLQEAGFATSRDAVRDYVSFAEDSWLLFVVPTFSHSIKEQERNYKKIYSIDWALANKNSSVWDGSLSQAFENLIYLHLRRTWNRVNYYLTKKGRQEVDFLVADSSGKPVIAMQACLDISSAATLERETEPLVATARYFGTKKNYIITLDQERSIKVGGLTIHVVPAWKWLLE
jgi:uncharacterized protein